MCSSVVKKVSSNILLSGLSFSKRMALRKLMNCGVYLRQHPVQKDFVRVQTMGVLFGFCRLKHDVRWTDMSLKDKDRNRIKAEVSKTDTKLHHSPKMNRFNLTKKSSYKTEWNGSTNDIVRDVFEPKESGRRDGFTHTGSTDTDTEDIEMEDGYRKNIKKITGSVVMFQFGQELALGQNVDWKASDWQKFESKVVEEGEKLRTIWAGLCMNLLYHHGVVDSAISLMKYLRDEGRALRLPTRTSFIALCGVYGGREYGELVLQEYDDLLKEFDLFDSVSCKQLIHGLSSTDRWREAIPLLEMSRLTQEPGSVCFTPIILAALRDGDISTVVEMLDIMGESDRIPQSKVFTALVDYCASGSNLFSFQNLFEYFRKYLWFPSTEVMETLAEVGRKENWHVSWTKMDRRGVCTQCGYQSGEGQLDPQEFQTLRDKFLERAVISSDVFLKTNPEEITKFYDFISKTAPYDVVLDSLNIVLGRASKAPVWKKAQVLHWAVNHFWKRGKKVLILGRKHMLTWPKQELRNIQQKASCFFADDISADDPFLLYAALYSGPHTLVVSNDQMRDHKYLLGPQMGQVFTKWQRSHQVYIMNVDVKRNTLNLLMPKAFDTLAQKDAGGWHIPYEDRADRSSYEHPNAWLCVRQN